MYSMSEFQLWREHRDELLREAERRRLIGELRAAQKERFRLRNQPRAKSKTEAPVPSTGAFEGEAREKNRDLAGVSHR